MTSRVAASRTEASTAHATLAEALVAAQADMPAVEPDAVNPHFRSKFVSLGHLIAKTRPVLNKHGLAIFQNPHIGEFGPVLRTTIMHQSGQQHADCPLLLAGNDMQKLGSAVTYARRYAWAAACGISDQEDDDGNQASQGSGSATPTAAGGGGEASARAAASPAAAGETKKTGELEEKLLDLSRQYALVNTEFDVQTVRDSIKEQSGQQNFGAWLNRGIARMEKNIAEARAEKEALKNFPIPPAAKEKAA